MAVGTVPPTEPTFNDARNGATKLRRSVGASVGDRAREPAARRQPLGATGCAPGHHDGRIALIVPNTNLSPESAPPDTGTAARLADVVDSITARPTASRPSSSPNRYLDQHPATFAASERDVRRSVEAEIRTPPHSVHRADLKITARKVPA
jgi:hypothetical protein